ncbi:MAG: HPP family protein [Nitrosomonadales bacterium]|nr:HPP family protein [Nitrosomonadales bacterium]
MNFKDVIAAFKPSFDPVPLSEKIRAALAAMTGILLMGFAMRFLPHIDYPLIMLASSAATAVLLYAAPHSPMAQPWAIVAGNLLSGMIGWACSLLIPDPVLAAGCAVGIAVLLMHLSHCLHPPGGATAMTMVLSADQFHHNGWDWAASTVLANAILSLLLALVINNLINGRRYPMPSAMKPLIASRPGDLGAEDIEWALTQMDGVIDVSEQDLLIIYSLASGHAARRTAK